MAFIKFINIALFCFLIVCLFSACGLNCFQCTNLEAKFCTAEATCADGFDRCSTLTTAGELLKRFKSYVTKLMFLLEYPVGVVLYFYNNVVELSPVFLFPVSQVQTL